MRLVVLSCAALALSACSHEFDVDRPSRVADAMPPPPDAPGYSHRPYTGKPKYLVAARPLQPTNSTGDRAAADKSCTAPSRVCEERLRALLASIDGQILALSTPPTELQLSALRLQAQQLPPLLEAYPDIAAEGDEVVATVGKLPSMTTVDAASARKRLVELSDLIRVQLAAGE